MKTFLVLISASAILMAIVPASAQNRIGVIGGVNLAKFEVSEVEPEPEIDNRTGFGIGGIIDLKIAPTLTLRLAPMYLQKGAKGTEEDPTVGTIDVEFKLDYLEVPVFLKLGLGGFYVMGGPTLGLNLKSKISAEAVDQGLTIDIDIDDAIKTFDIGFGVGGGFNIPMGLNTLFVEGRYILGLANIAEAGGDGTGDEVTIEGKVKNRGIQVMAGITFPLGL